MLKSRLVKILAPCGHGQAASLEFSAGALCSVLRGFSLQCRDVYGADYIEIHIPLLVPERIGFSGLKLEGSFKREQVHYSLPLSCSPESRGS